MAQATLHICTTCRRGTPDPEAPRPGAVLHGAILGADLPEGVAPDLIRLQGADGTVPGAFSLRDTGFPAAAP